MKLPNASLQIAFSTLLDGSRKTVLREALRETVRHMSVPALDAELAHYVDPIALAKLASFSLRGESVFPTPSVLTAKPSLIGYYRLLYGFSQKAFYSSSVCGPLKNMELKGKLTPATLALLPKVCAAFAEAGSALLDGVESHLTGADLLHELCLLTLGAQYRGSANNDRGSAGIRSVFETIRAVVDEAIVSEGETSITIVNAAGKRVEIAVASDPDILIRSQLSTNVVRPIVAIEVKAGEDHSNIHNRIGEAEKSHLKARARGVTECWTIINVPNADIAQLARESRSTDRFYQMNALADPEGAVFAEFRDRLRDLVGL